MLRLVQAPMKLSAEERGFISLNCSYFLMDDSRIPDNFTWCKMVTATRCQPVVSVKIDQIVNMRERTRIKLDRWNRVIIVTLVALQLRDSGEYHCETHLQGSTGGNLHSQLTLIVARVISHSWYSEVNLSVLCIMAGLLSTKFLTALLIFIVASKRRSRATDQCRPGLDSNHPILRLVTLRRTCLEAKGTKDMVFGSTLI
uniref:Immunoglobulin V-set domain-containing protein n=1 Tax=Terrapene triunguis TaxID=2587831 RepID=A0A674K8M5_9SAUR